TLKLSADMAAKMSYETGISIKWLMDGDPKARPVSTRGTEYTKEIYDNNRAAKKHFATVKDADVKNTVLDALCAICTILVNANRKRNFHLAVYRTAKAIAELRDEFCKEKDYYRIDEALAYVGLAFLPPEVPEHLREGVRRIQQMLRDNAPTNVVDLSKKPT